MRLVVRGRRMAQRQVQKDFCGLLGSQLSVDKSVRSNPISIDLKS